MTLRTHLFRHLPLAALLLACPAPGAAHGHGAHEGQHPHGPAAETHEGHNHAAQPHKHAAGEACDGHKHDHKAEKHDHAGEKACDGHGHAPSPRGHEGHDHAADAPCSGGDSHEGHDHASGMAEAVIVTADPHSRHLIALQVEDVPEPGGALSSSLYGTLSAPEHALQAYSLPAAGRITLHVKSAQQVRAGDLLCTVESPTLTDQVAAVEQGEANLTRCKEEIAALAARIERLKEVGTRNSDIEEQLTFKRAEERQLTRDLETSQSRVRMLALGAEIVTEGGLSRLVIKAGKAGTVRNVGVAQGSWGEQGAAIITISDPAALEIVASLYANDMPTFNRVRAHIPQGRENLDVAGSWRLAEQVNPKTQTRALYFTPDTLPEGARPGQLCRLDLYNDSAACGNTVSIPDSAIVRVGMDDIVFIEIEPGRYAATKVHAGESRRGMTPVSGLHAGQRIVVKGGYELKYILPSGDGQKKKAGHFHADGKFHEGEH